MGRHERPQASDRPILGDGRPDADLQALVHRRGAAARPQGRHPGENLREGFGQGHPGRGRGEAGMETPKEGRPDEGFQPAQTMAHRALRDAYLRRGEGHAAVSQDRLEGGQRVEWGLMFGPRIWWCGF